MALVLGLAQSALPCRIVPYPIIWDPPRPMPEPMRGIETRMHRAVIDVTDSVATVTVEATFFNPNPVQMEGTYLFPIEKTAAAHRAAGMDAPKHAFVMVIVRSD